MSLVEWREHDGSLKPFRDGVEVAWAPQEGSQDAFLQCPVYEAILEGNRGGGKTDVLLMDFAREVGKGYGIEWRGIIFRRTHKQLRREVLKKTKKWFPKIFPSATFNSNDMAWRWPGGEELLLCYMDKEDDYWEYHGNEYPWIGWEELTTWPDDTCYRIMMSVSRSPRVGIPRRIRATTNPYGCVPFGEVLTSEGWRDIREVGAGDQVVSFNRRGRARLSTVERRTEREHDGVLIVREGRGLRMVFTPNHRLPLVRDGGENELRSFDALPGQADLLGAVADWEGSPLAEWSVPEEYAYVGRRRKLAQPLTLNGEDYAALMGWYLTEGSCSDRDRAIYISQSKPATRQKLEALLDRARFSFGRTANQVWISSHEWWSYLRTFGHAKDKRAPREILDAETPVLRAFLEAAVGGDGHWTNTGFQYGSISEGLRDDVAEAAVKLGHRVSFTDRLRDGREHRSYELCASRARPVQLHTGNHVYDVETENRSVNVERRPFRGTVYCLVVPGDESFLIRQGKNVWLSGNCGHNWVKARFKLPVLPGRICGPIIRDGDDPPRVAVHSDLKENKVLLHADPEYLDRILAAAPNDACRKAWAAGDWDIVAGGMFDDLWDPRHHVVPNISIEQVPRRWRLDRAYDHGQSKPFSVGWWAESNGEPIEVDGRLVGVVPGDLVRIYEWYGWNGKPNEGVRMLHSRIAEGIIEREDDWNLSGLVRTGPADSQIFAPYEAGRSVASDMRKKGVRWKAVSKERGSRVQGWQLVRERLAHALPGPDGTREEPGLFVCERCEQFLRTVPVLPRSDKDLDDVDTEAEDHVGDEVRYRVRNKPAQAKGRNF